MDEKKLLAEYLDAYIKEKHTQEECIGFIAGFEKVIQHIKNPNVAIADSTRESLSDYAHEAWCGWMKYMFSKAETNQDGTWTMPKWAVERWQRQMNTKYTELPEEEKKSDREEADKMLAIFHWR